VIRTLAAPPYRALRWLLRMDQPVPSHTDQELAAEVERHYKWNYAVNLLDGASFWFGGSFISSSTILPLFISKLTSNPLPVGLLAVIAQSAWFLPQLFTANAVERLARKKPVVVNLGLFTERLPLWGLILAALATTRSPSLALAVFFISYAGHGLGAGIIASAWQELIARCFPVNRRGGFLGLTNFLGAGTGALGAVFSAWLLRTFPFPTNFAYTFTVAAGMILLSWFFLSLTREPARAVTVPRKSNREFLVGLPVVLRYDHNFRRFLIARMLIALGSMGSGFVTVAAVQRWHVPDGTVGIYTAILLLGQTAANLTFGLLADHFGHKLCLELSAAASALGFGLAWLAASAEWYYAVFVLSGIASSAILGSAILIVMEFCEPQRIPTYVGIGNTGVGLIGIIAPLIGAGLAQVNYGLLFAVSSCVGWVAFILMRWWVREPRQAEKLTR
jgi:MFS family permease